MTAVATCPQCQLQLSVPDEANADSLVKCPVCRSTFELSSVRLAPMLKMIVVPAPRLPSATRDAGLEEPAAFLPPASETDRAPLRNEADELALQEEATNDIIGDLPDRPVDPLLDLTESLSDLELNSSVDEAVQGPYADHQEQEVLEESYQDYTPLENPEPTEIDEDLAPEVSQGLRWDAEENGAESQAVDELSSPSDSLPHWRQEHEPDLGLASAGESADLQEASSESWSESTAGQTWIHQQDEHEAQTESLELEEDSLEVPFSSREPVANGTLPGALPDNVQPLFADSDESQPMEIGDEGSQPHVDQEVLASEIERIQAASASEQHAPVDELPATSPAATIYQSSWFGEQTVQEQHAAEPAEHEVAPPVEFGSWQPEAQPEVDAGSESVEALRVDADDTAAAATEDEELPKQQATWPVHEESMDSTGEAAAQVDDLSHDEVDDEVAVDEPESLEMSHSAIPEEQITYSEPAPFEEQFAGDDPMTAAADTYPLSQPEDVEPPLDEYSKATLEAERRKNAQIPLPGLDRKADTPEQSWFRSWMVLAALVVLGGAGATGMGLWSLWRGGDPPGVQLAESRQNTTPEAPAATDSTPTVQTEPSPDRTELATFESVAPLPAATESAPTGPMSTPTEPGTFQEPRAQPLRPATHVLDAPTYSLEEMSEAFTAAQQAEQLLVAEDATPQAKADSYVYLCDLAEKLTFLADDGGSYMMKLDAKDIFRRILVEPRVRQEVAQLAQMWLDSPTRLETGLSGIVVVGTLSDVQYRGGAYEYFIDGGVGEPFRFVVPEPLDGQLFRAGEQVTAAGAIVENPEQAIVGYKNGDAQRIIWAGVVKLLDRPNAAPKDRRLSIFQNP